MSWLFKGEFWDFEVWLKIHVVQISWGQQRREGGNPGVRPNISGNTVIDLKASTSLQEIPLFKNTFPKSRIRGFLGDFKERAIPELFVRDSLDPNTIRSNKERLGKFCDQGRIEKRHPFQTQTSHGFWKKNRVPRFWNEFSGILIMITPPKSSEKGI